MPKILFYSGTGFCLFLALISAAEAVREAQLGVVSFAALRGIPLEATGRPAWAIVVALLGSVATAAILIRMSALVAARNLFSAFAALLAITAGVTSLAWTLLLQARIVSSLSDPGRTFGMSGLAETHLATTLAFTLFLSMALLALRPYFRIQASRTLAAMVLFPFPLSMLIIAQELFIRTSAAPLPGSTPALLVLLLSLSLIFLGVSLHCVRHRHLFIEMTNLRAILDSRIDPAPAPPVRLGGPALDA
ncbi:MAG TPA: hypothetical protein VFL80_06610 [Thermoanaerobaculia bacterium]|nr:hypothetical protein [Thermoanaerobaculia bacterium]